MPAESSLDLHLEHLGIKGCWTPTEPERIVAAEIVRALPSLIPGDSDAVTRWNFLHESIDVMISVIRDNAKILFPADGGGVQGVSGEIRLVEIAFMWRADEPAQSYHEFPQLRKDWLEKREPEILQLRKAMGIVAGDPTFDTGPVVLNKVNEAARQQVGEETSHRPQGRFRRFLDRAGSAGTKPYLERISARLFRKDKPATDGGSALREIGILFDIDALGDLLYGQQAYKILFDSLDPQRLTGCSFHDGDTNATIAGNANLYCIVIQSSDPLKINYVRDALSARTDNGLLTVDRRFTEGDILSHEPLVYAGVVDVAGNLVVQPNDLIQERWTEGTVWKVVIKH